MANKHVEETAARSSGEDASRPAGRFHALWVRLRPAARQGWMNVKVWVPFLLNPADRAREVIYHAREHREGFTWHIRLPRQCWRCGRDADLWDRQLEIDLRGFEYPLTVVGGALGSALFFWFFAAVFRSWWMLLLGLAALVVGAGVLYAKSWLETVKIDLATCHEDADVLRFPGMVVHENELYLFLPTEGLTQAARAALKAERLGRDRALPGAPRGTESDVEPPTPQERYRSPYGPPSRPAELPPIKLAGDDDEA